MTFDDFKFKIGDVVVHRASSVTPTIGMVLERYMEETPAGINKLYLVRGVGLGPVEVYEVEIAEV